MQFIPVLIFSVLLLVLVFITWAAIVRYTIRRAWKAQKTLDDRFWEIIEPLRYRAGAEADEDKVTGE